MSLIFWIVVIYISAVRFDCGWLAFWVMCAQLAGNSEVVDSVKNFICQRS